VSADHQETLFDVFFRDVPSHSLEKMGRLNVEGDRRLWNGVVRAFTRPATGVAK
jgi:hypothetical protein